MLASPDKVIVEDGGEMANSRVSSSLTPTEYAEASMAPRCPLILWTART